MGDPKGLRIADTREGNPMNDTPKASVTVNVSRLFVVGAFVCFVLALFGIEASWTFKLGFVLWTASAIL
jgi:hypothetical protein